MGHRTVPGFSWGVVVDDEASLPVLGNDGDFHFALSEETLHYWKGGTWNEFTSGGGGGGGTWGSITGTLSDQLDLIAALNAKAPLDSPTFTTKTTHSYATATTVAVFNGSKELVSDSALDVALGGTNISSYTSGDLLYASGATTLSKLAKGTTLQYLRMNSGATAPEWATLAAVTGPGSSTDNAQARWNGTGGTALQDGKWIEDDNGRITVDIGDTATGATYGVRWTATLTGTAGGIHAIERADVTTAGSGAGAFVLGRWMRLLAGYTGGGMCVGDWVINNCASTGTDLNGGAGNMGYRCSMGGSGGHSAGYYANITAASTNSYGFRAELEISPASGVGIGLAGTVGGGSGTFKGAGVYGKLTSGVGANPNATAAGFFDNGTTTFPGLIVQDNSTTMFQVTDGANVVCGALSALATNATDGFLNIPTCAGIPTGVPTAYTGKVPMIYDTSNNNLYIYNSGWKKTTVFA